MNVIGATLLGFTVGAAFVGMLWGVSTLTRHQERKNQERGEQNIRAWTDHLNREE